MLNLDIIFNGRANFAQAQTGIKKLRAEYAMLGETIAATQAQTRTTGSTKGFEQQRKQIQALRKDLLNIADASGSFATETKNITSASRTFNDELAKNKIRFRDMVSNMGTVKQAYREQLAIQNMMATSWQRSASGKMSVDMFLPKELAPAVDNFRNKLGYANTLLRSGSEQMINWGKNTQWAGRQLMVGFTVPTMIAAGAAAKLGYDMDKALTKIVKVYGDAATASSTSSQTIRDNATATAKSVAASYGQSFKDTLSIQAELAATGMTGAPLQTATREVSRAKMLGDLNTQDAMKATITLMSAYGLKADDLTKKFDFMNSVENSTVLTMQDMVEAFPRVSGIMNALGVSVEQTSVLLTAFKAAGIDAEEGATALKSISFKAIAPTPTSEAAFMGLTGKSLKGIVDTTKGELLPTIEAISNAMGDMDRAGKTELIARVFGIHQGSKAFALIDQLQNIEDKTTQIGRAWDVANQGSEQWANTAKMELSALQNSLSGQFNRAIETAKGNLAELGQTVLAMALPLVEAAGKFVAFLNNLDDGSKKFALWTLAAVGAIGPVVMFAGLLGNLIGTAGKVTAMIANLGLRFKLMSEEERAAAIIQNQMKHSLDGTDLAAANLARAIQLLDDKLVIHNKTMQATAVATGAMTQAQVNAVNAVAVGQQQTATAKKEKASIISGKVGGAASMGGLALSMLSDNGAMQSAGNALFIAGAVAPLITNLKLVSKVGDGAKAMFGKMAGSMTPIADGAKKIGSSWSNLAGKLGMSGGAAALGVTAILGGILVLHEKINAEIEETNRKYNALASSGNAWANALGFSPAAVAASAAGDGKMRMTQQVDALKQASQDIFDTLSQHQTDGYDVGEKWAVAINEGLKTKMAGGNEQNIRDTIQTSLAAMGEYFTKEEFDLIIKTKLNLNIDSDQVQATVDNLKAVFQDVANKANEGKDGIGETIGRALTLDTQMNSVDAGNISAGLTSFWSTYKKMNKQEAAKAFESLKEQVQVALHTMYEASGKNVSFDEFVKTDHRALDFLQSVLDKSKELNNIAMDRPLNDLNDLMNVMNGVPMGFKPAEAAIHAVGAANKLAAMDAARNEREQSGLTPTVVTAGNAAAQAAFGWTQLNDALDKVGISGDNVVDALKGAMSHANDLAFQAADDQFNNVVDARVKAIQDQADRTSANIDRQIDASKAKFDAAGKAMQRSQKAQNNALDDMQDNRKKTTAAYWDAQIKAIDDHKDALEAQTKAEQDADDARQRFFEAEQARIQRMAEIKNRDLDFNAALSAGNLDEAVRIQNDAVAAQAGYNTEDAQKTMEEQQRLAEAAATRLNDALDRQKTLLQENKQSSLDALDAVEQAEKEALQARQESEQEALDHQKDMDQQRLDSAKKSAQDAASAKIEATKKASEAAKRALDEELAALKTFIPKDQAELNAHIQTIEGAYAAHGYQVNVTGGQWGQILNSAITTGVKGSLQTLANAGEWNQTGQQIAERLVAGAFPGMDLKGLVEFIMTGKLPDATVDATGSPELKLAQQRATIKYNNMDKMGFYHTGGVAGVSGGGYGGQFGSAKEIPATLLQGEGILNLNAMSRPGMSDWVDKANKGQAGIGGPDMGFAGLMVAGVVGGLIKAALTRGIQNGVALGYQKKMENEAASAGAGLSYNGPMGNYKLGNVRPQTQAVANLLGPMFGIGTIGGYRPYVGPPDDLLYGHGAGLALDFMTGGDSGKGQRLADYVHAHANDLGLQYEIWQQHIFSRERAQEGWRAMANRGSPTANHMDHVHVSLSPNPGSGIAALLAGGGTGAGASLSGALAAGGWIRPADGPRTSPFGMRRNPVTGITSLHDGSDIGAPMGSPIRAARSGTVSKVAQYNPAWAGLYTMINHGGGIQTGYAHQSAQNVSVGQSVPAGATIGRVGSTGNSTGAHLHFQYIKDGVAINPGTIIPGLLSGAQIMKSGLASLHMGETVLPRPLSRSLEEGINNIGSGGDAYQVQIDFHGPVNSQIDFQRGVEEALREVNKRKGDSRRLGR